MTGTSESPTSCAARQRRSPAIRSWRPSVLRNEIDPFLQRFGREIFPWLQRTRTNRGQPHLVNRLANIDILSNSRWSRADKRAQTLAETGLRHLSHVFEAIGSLE